MKGWIAHTDREWFNSLTQQARSVGGSLDTVNFWIPSGQAPMTLDPGAPFFLRLGAPERAIAGLAFYATLTRLSVLRAWEEFGTLNGADHFLAFKRVIYDKLRVAPDADPRFVITGCLLLRAVDLWPPEAWIPWGSARGYADTGIQRGKGIPNVHDMPVLAERLVGKQEEILRELHGSFEPLLEDERRRRLTRGVVREGQRVFRLRLIDAYKGRCAISRERTLPALDAAHVQDYLGPPSNNLQNGLLLRADLHHLYDAGYLTVLPDRRISVSDRIREEFENGRDYYKFRGDLIRQPDDPRLRPSESALAWHAENRFEKFG